MADFPTLPIGPATRRAGPFYDVKTSRAKSGKRTSACWQLQPMYRWTISVARLSRDLNGDELATLVNFIAARRGTYDSFGFTCPLDGTSHTVVFDTPEIEIEWVGDRISEVPSISLVTALS